MEVSIYKNVLDQIGAKGNLISFLTTDKWKDLSTQIRNEKNPQTKLELKKKLPACCVSGLFEKRCKSGLIKHSGFICIDIDAKDNPSITDWQDFIFQLGNIQEVYFANISVSGNGAFCLIRIKDPNQHESHFKAICEDFNNLGIKIDESGKDVSRLRFYSYNERYYLNKDAKVYTKVYKPKVTKLKQIKTSDNDVERLIKKIVSSGVNLTESYNDWFKVGSALSNVPNGRYYFHQLSRLSSKYNYKECDKQFDKINPNGGIGIATLFEVSKQHGITLI